MQADSLIEAGHRCGRHLARLLANTTDGYRADLLSLCFGLSLKARIPRFKEYLKRIHTLDIGSHRNDRDDAAAEPVCCRIRAIVADHDGGSNLGGF